MGISPYRYKVLQRSPSPPSSAVRSGFLYIAVVQYTSPETLSFATSINLVAAMVIGGSASILGTVLGAIYFVMLPVVAGQIDSSRTALISGAALLLVLFLLPGGLVSLPRRIAQLVGAAAEGPPQAVRQQTDLRPATPHHAPAPRRKQRNNHGREIEAVSMKNSLKPNKRVIGTIAVLGVLALTVTGCTRTATDGGAGAVPAPAPTTPRHPAPGSPTPL